tara:strand:- start:13752 stop:14093 length:342 start_codon:yes stop_codon:yes gene_type:complete
MDRYFRTTNATRTYRVNGYSFTFDKLAYASGSWSGTLAVSGDQGEALASHGAPVVEISQTEYNDLKKKQGIASPHTGLPKATNPPEEKTPEGNVVDVLEEELVMGSVDPLESM